MIFHCPICHATIYELLPPQGEPGMRAATRLYSCAGCTFVFADPARATRPGRGVPGQPVASPDFKRVHSPGQTAAARPPLARKSQRTRGRTR